MRRDEKRREEKRREEKRRVPLGVLLLLSSCDLEEPGDAAGVERVSAAGSAEQLPDQPTGQVADAEGAMAEEGPACLGLSELACGHGADRAFVHPLTAAGNVNGQIPGVDLHVGPRGNVYAVLESIGENETGQRTWHSGVVELETTRPSPTEHARLRAAKVAADPNAEPTRMTESLSNYERRVTKTLRDQVDRAERWSPGALHVVGIRIRRPVARPSLHRRLERAIAEGRVATYADHDRIRQELLIDLRDETARDLAGLRHRLAGRAEELYTCQHMGCIYVRASADLIEDLVEDPDVALLDSPPLGLVDEQATPNTSDGFELSHIHQHRRFWDAHYGGFNLDGENGTGSDLLVAVLDQTGFRDTHVAFREGSGTATRIAGRWNCGDSACNSVSQFTPSEHHGTEVLGALMGDFRDGQLATATTAQREQYSAPAGEAQAYLYRPSSFSFPSVDAALDHAVARSPKPLMAVMSFMVNPGVIQCGAADIMAWSADDMFELGVPVFKSAGNEEVKQGSTTTCSVTRPGDAMGSFTVGAYAAGGTICDERSALPHANTAWGGSPTVYDQGRHRSIVDLVSTWDTSFRPSHVDDTSLIHHAGGTSFSNPTVAGGAVALVDMMRNAVGSSILDNNPGMLFALLLAMGDRSASTGSKLTVGFDQRMGAGRLALRFLDSAGMDAPWAWAWADVCVGHGETVKFPIAAPVGDVDAFRAAAFWYDRRVENDVNVVATDLVDDIDLTLRQRSTGVALRASNHAWDNKERVYHEDIGGLGALDVELHGYRVTSDEAGCGTNRMRVWLAYFWEDSDRDDTDGPSYNGTTCEGVAVL